MARKPAGELFDVRAAESFLHPPEDRVRGRLDRARRRDKPGRFHERDELFGNADGIESGRCQLDLQAAIEDPVENPARLHRRM
jgi:hypothetical protein